MKDELTRLQEETDKAEREYLAALKRFRDAEQAVFQCLQRRLLEARWDNEDACAHQEAMNRETEPHP